MKSVKTRRRLYISLLFVFILVFLSNAYHVLKIIDDSKSTKNNLIYTNSSAVNYTINISENDFIKSSDLKSYETYISNLVNDIDMTMNYKYSGSEKINLEERHKVTATIYGQYNETPNDPENNPIMWKKEYVLIDEQYKKYQTSSTFNVSETFNLDWKTYNQEIENFKMALSLPTVAYLEVKLEVKFNGGNGKYSLNENQTVIARMPLGGSVFDVDALKENVEQKSVASKDIVKINREQRKLTAYIILTITTILLILITIKQIMMSKDKKPFIDELDQIKDDYNEIIIEAKNMVETKGLKPVVIASFEEMLNLSDSVMLPILLFEEHDKATFYIVKSDMIYIYIMKNK